jgi:hypothetical protein
MEIREVTLAPRRFVGRVAATLGAVAVLSIMTLAFASAALAAQAPVNLGTTSSYAVLAGTTVTNTGPTLVNGNLGLSPGSSVTGFPPGLVTGGVQNVANAQAVQAQSDLVTAYDDAAGRTPATTVLGDSLGGLTLVAGLYSGGALDLTGTLTLDAQGDTGAVFIFQAASTLITASASRVNLVNGASPCNVFWQVGSSATLGTTTIFKGTILALTSIGLNTGATVDGRLLARNGAVTLDDNTINSANCTPAPPVRTATTIVTQVHNPAHADVTNGSVVAGTAVHDSATVTGTSPTGTVTYHFFATGQGSCSGPSTDQTVAVGAESSSQTLAVGSYAYKADYSGDANNEPSTGACEPFRVVAGETTPPICVFYVAATNAAGQAIRVDAKVQDNGSGLASIVKVSSSNVTVQIPSFALGTKSPVIVPGLVIKPSLANSMTLEIRDLAGNIKRCDPIVLTLRGRKGGVAVRSQRFLVPQAESKLRIVNRGLTRIDVIVNGRRFSLRDLRQRQRVSRNLASAMHRGNANKVRFVAYGRRGATAVVFLSD